MKNTFVILVLLSITPESFGQDSLSAPTRIRDKRDNFDSDYDNGELIIGLYTTVVSFRNIETKWGIGMDAEYMLGGHFGFGMVISGGTDYGEISSSLLGLLGFSSWNSSSSGGRNSSSSGGIGVILIPFAFTNPNIHFKVKGSAEFVLSFDFLKFRYMHDKHPYYDTDQFYSGSAKLRYSKFFGLSWQWSLFVEESVLYQKDQAWGFQAGVAIRYATAR